MCSVNPLIAIAWPILNAELPLPRIKSAGVATPKNTKVNRLYSGFSARRSYRERIRIKNPSVSNLRLSKLSTSSIKWQSCVECLATKFAQWNNQNALPPKSTVHLVLSTTSESRSHFIYSNHQSIAWSSLHTIDPLAKLSPASADRSPHRQNPPAAIFASSAPASSICPSVAS